jgi:hypothetical protein
MAHLHRARVDDQADPWSEIALPVQGPAASDGDPVEVFPINQPSLSFKEAGMI